MSKKDFFDLGDQIKYTVEDAINSRDFTRLKREISDIAGSTLDGVWRNFKGGSNQSQERDYNYNREEQQWETPRNPVNRSVNYSNGMISKKPKGHVSGVLFIVFGSLGMGVSAILLLVYGLIDFILGKYSIVNSISVGIFLMIFGSSIFTMARGINLKKRVNRFKKYVKGLRGRSYCFINELATHSNQPSKFVVKDLKKMIKLGMFPQAHIDDQETCLMLNYEVYEQYLMSKKALELRKQEELKRQEEEKAAENIKDPAMKELRNVINEGKNCIMQIKVANDAIPGEEISRKLYRLEDITSKIFNYVEKHPQKLPEINKFMKYYLPITLKLVNGYKELDAQPIQGENIITAKQEIQDILDTINVAFENLLDKLFQDVAFDISSDISVLETMLSQEGLTESDFKKQSK
ncbi:MAG: 5-bromo-4-chloroindolyl phosphate hydrolysis family protein [Clostridium sp.]|uniref:5-bromo-4-chloroindolyl phosphate hydrolysis family protein n=1 Tax=Clostridium sp. TaxID=1506 RepID=UPI0030744A5F